MRDIAYVIVFTPIFLLMVSCGVPQPTPTSSGGGPDEPEKKVLSEDEIEAVMDERLGLVDAGEDEQTEEPGAGDPSGGEPAEAE